MGEAFGRRRGAARGLHQAFDCNHNKRLAVLTDRDSAVAAALAHELAPVSVH